MLKFFKAIKSKPTRPFSRKALLDEIEALEAQVADLQTQIMILEKKSKKKTTAKANKKTSQKDSVSAEILSARKIAFLEEQTQKRREEERENHIQTLMQKTGWTYAYAAAQLKDAKSRIGISYADYVRHGFYDIALGQQKEAYDRIVAEAKEEKAKTRAKKDEGYISVVMNATGWDRNYAVEQIKKANKANGVSYEHYAIYRFWELTPEEQKTYFSKGDADRLRDKYNTNPKILRCLTNKDLFCKNFEEFLGRPWIATANMQLEEFKEKFGTIRKVIYKPLKLSGGRGIQVFTYDEDGIEDLYNMLRTLPQGVVEGYVVQHPEMQKLSLNSVNTIRFVTIQTYDDVPGVEKGKIHFVYGGVRMGNGTSYVDNLHSGGMIACINIETGVVETDGVDFANRVFETHPDTNVRIKGFRIPYFQEAKKLIEKAGEGIPGYLGWDIAITENGPIIIEINTHPGADGLQTPFVVTKEGKRYVIEKYLAEEKKQDRIPEKPYGTKISGITKEGIEFYWKKLEIADGYEVFRSYEENGEFEKIAVIEGRSIGTYIDAEFDHSKKSVYYTVRSFVNNGDGTRSYSVMLEPKEAVFRENLELERDATYLYSGISRNIRAFWGWGEPEHVTWSSDNTNVATVSEDGTIVGVSSGTCTLTCVCEEIAQSATTLVVVDREACEPLAPVVSRYQFNRASGCWENVQSGETNDAVIMMVGDMMCGKRQMEKQVSADQGWNFNDSFEYVKEITASADFSVGNLETLLAAGWPYMLDEAYIDNMNNCNATSRYLDAVRYGGFDAVVMSNNHNCDGGRLALMETVDQVEKYQLAHTGVFRNDTDDRFFIANVNGIHVGFVSYISAETGFNGKDANWTKEDKDTLLNVFSKEKAEADIAACRKAGAEYIIAYMHWGFKNFKNVVRHQYEDAMEVAEAGADYIVGSNPHLIQHYEVLTTADGRKVPCAYSVGNFQAVMKQVKGNRDSVILRIRLQKDGKGKVALTENGYIPTYTYTQCMDSNWAPVSVSKSFNTTVNKKNRKSICDRIVAAMGKQIAQL